MPRLIHNQLSISYNPSFFSIFQNTKNPLKKKPFQKHALPQQPRSAGKGRPGPNPPYKCQTCPDLQSFLYHLPRGQPQMDQNPKSNDQNSDFIEIESSHEIIEIESSHQVIEIESSHQVIEIESSHEIIEIESSSEQSRFQDSYYNISYDPNREDTLDLAEEESSILFSGQLEICSQSESSFEEESNSFTGSPNDYHDLFSQVDMDHLRDLIEERMGPLPSQSSEMSQVNSVEQESENIIQDSDEQDVETPQRENRRKTKMIKKTLKK